MTRLLYTAIAAPLLIFASCVRLPYKSLGETYPNPAPFKDEPQITRGDPNVVADGLGHYLFSLPEKLILWNWKMGNHDISPETEKALQAYLEANKITETKVRLNEYAPFGEWRRLTNNQAVGAGWRYTIGVLSWLFYTVLPGRIFGGDSYNPYTNTISLYSDLTPVALHEGGHAKDTARTEHKGSWAALRILPLYPLRDEAYASTDAISYFSKDDDRKHLKSSYKLLYPAFGTYIGGEAALFFPGVRLAATAIGAIPGHIVGRIKAANVPDDQENLGEKTEKNDAIK